MFSIIAILENLIASGLDRTIVDNWKKKKKDILLQESIDRIINREKNNQYYNKLDKVLTNTKIIPDYISSLCNYKSFPREERIYEYCSHEGFSSAETKYIFDTINELFETIKSIHLKGDDPDTDRLHYVIDETYNDFKNLLKKDSISSFTGDKIKDLSTIIPRLIIPNNDISININAENLKSPINYILQDYHIVIVGEAGAGKTYALYQICHEATEKGIHPIYLSLKHNSFPRLLKLLDDNKITLDCKSIIILDGLDEMNDADRSFLLLVIQKITKLFPYLYIVLSIRTVFYTNEIEGFITYKLLPINNKDMDKYLQNKNIDISSFKEAVQANNLTDICQNPFFFTEIANIWLVENKLPNTALLMNTIIDVRIGKDIDKYEFSNQTLQKEQIKKCLEKAAFVMQCTQQYTINESELIRIIGKDKIIQLEYNGLWEQSDTQTWGFTHNNFKEYFASLILSRMNLDTIKLFLSEQIDNKDYIRPSWYNVLPFLLTKHNRSLIEWISELHPDLIMRLEKERFSNEERFSLFTRLVNQYKSKNRAFDFHFDRNMGSFCSTDRIINYILTELQMPIPYSHKLNILLCLYQIDSFRGHEGKIYNTITSILFDDKEELTFRRIALEIADKNTDLFQDCYDQLVDLYHNDTYISTFHYGSPFFIDEDEDEDNPNYILDHVDLDLMHTETRLADTNWVEKIIQMLYEWRKESNLTVLLDIYSHIKLEDLESHKGKLYEKFTTRLLNLQSRAEICEALSYFSENTNSIRHARDVYTHCCQIAAQYYSGTEDEIIQYLLNTLDRYEGRYNDLFGCSIWGIREYIELTNTSALFYNYVSHWDNSDKKAWTLSILLCEPMLELVIKEYENGKIETDLYKKIIDFYKYNEEISSRLTNILLRKTGEKIALQTYPKVKSENKEKGYHEYINSLFDKDEYITQLRKINKILGDDFELTQTIPYWYVNELEDNWILYYTLLGINRISKKLEISTFASLYQEINNWDVFFIWLINDLLKHTEPGITSMKNYNFDNTNFSSEQRNKIIKTILHILKPEKISSIQPDSYIYKKMIQPCMRIIVTLDIDCPYDILIFMLTIPPLDLAIFRGVGISIYDIPAYLLQRIPHETLKNEIINNIKRNRWNKYVAPSYMFFCKQYQVQEVLQEIIDYLLNTKDDWKIEWIAMDYLCETFGYSILLSELIPKCKNETLLESICSCIPSDIHNDILDNALLSIYQKPGNEWALRKLIEQSNVEALEYIYHITKDQYPLPEITKATEIDNASRHLYTLQLLINLLVFYLNHDNVLTIKNITYSHFAKAIINMSSYHFDDVISYVKKNRTFDDSTMDKNLLWLINEILDKHKIANDTPLSFDYTLTLLQKYN